MKFLENVHPPLFVTCFISFIKEKKKKMMGLVGGGAVINAAKPVNFFELPSIFKD